jgi:hypothetical protein
MRRNYQTPNKTTVAFIKWRQCLIFHNNNKEENQPVKCKKLYKIYNDIVEENIQKLNQKKYH